MERTSSLILSIITSLQLQQWLLGPGSAEMASRLKKHLFLNISTRFFCFVLVTVCKLTVRSCAVVWCFSLLCFVLVVKQAGVAG